MSSTARPTEAAAPTRARGRPWRRAEASPPRRNPFPGARPYTSAEHEAFRGRDRESDEIATLLVAKRLLLLHAPSGAGKSSMIHASLLRRLAAPPGGADVAGVRPGKVDLIGVASVHPGGVRRVDGSWPPSSEVPNVYVTAALDSLGSGARSPHGDLGSFLASRPVRRDIFGDPLPRLLVVDQFEEVLEPFARADWLACRLDLVEQLRAALERDVPLHVLLAIRDDHLASIERLLAVVPARYQARYALDLLARDRAAEAVRGPAELSGLPMAPATVERLVDDLSSQTLAGPRATVPTGWVHPSQLSVVCRRLWAEADEDGADRVEPHHLESLGGVGGSLKRYYTDTLRASAGIWRMPTHRFITTSLISRHGTRQLAPFDDQARRTGLVPNRVLRELDQQGIVRTERRGGTSYLELSHDGLVEPIRTAYPLTLRKFLAILVAGWLVLAVLTGALIDGGSVDESGAAPSVPAPAGAVVVELPAPSTRTFAGSMRGGGEVEAFHVDLADNVLVTVETSTAAGSSADPVLTVRGPDESLVALDDDDGSGLNARVVHRTAVAGTYQLLVQPWGTDVDATGDFELTVTVVEGSTKVDELNAPEPVQRSDEGLVEPLAPGDGFRIEGTLTSDEPSAAFDFDLLDPARLELEVEVWEGAGVATLTVRGPDGNLVATEAGSGRLVVDLPRAGIHQLLVTLPDGEGSPVPEAGTVDVVVSIRLREPAVGADTGP